jgi:hypothetical protein
MRAHLRHARGRLRIDAELVVEAPGAHLLAQQQQLRAAVGDFEPKIGVEPLGPVQVRLLEFQPGQADDLDQRVLRPAGVLASPGAVLAVQRAVRVLPGRTGGRQRGCVVSLHGFAPHLSSDSPISSVI